MAEIELKGVAKRFAGATAVKNVSLTIRDGECFVLVGPSGCGKSTLLNMIVGLEEVAEGEIRLDGRRVNDLDPKDRNMAMVFQSYALYPHMTVRANMAFPLKLAKRPKQEIDERIAEAAHILELEDLLDRKPHALSGGQRQRVAMGRAIVREPAVFLLDEPLSNLDAKLRAQMRTEIARLQRRLGTTMVYVTHDQAEAMTLGDRIAVMHEGQVLQIGTPREIYEQPASLFVAGFVGSPPMDFLPARRSEGTLELPVGSFELSQAVRRRVEAAEGPLLAGIRPDRLRVVEGGGGQDGDGKGQDADGLRFEARADVVEWLGTDLFVYFDVSRKGFEAMGLPAGLDAQIHNGVGHPLVARIDPAVGVEEGDTVHLCLQPEDVQLFDARSGANLTLAGESSR